MIARLCVVLCLASAALPATATATEMTADMLIKSGRDKKLKGDFEGAAQDAREGFDRDHSRVDGIYNYVCYLDLDKALPENVWYGVYDLYDAVKGSPTDKEKYWKLLREDPDLKRLRTLREFRWAEALFTKDQGPYHVLAKALGKAMKMDIHYRVLEEMGLDAGSGVDIKDPAKMPWIRVVMSGWNDKKDRDVKFRLNLKTGVIEKLTPKQLKDLKELFTEHFKVRTVFFTGLEGQKPPLLHTKAIEAVEQVSKLYGLQKSPALKPEDVTREGNVWETSWKCCAKDPKYHSFFVDVWTGRTTHSASYDE